MVGFVRISDEKYFYATMRDDRQRHAPEKIARLLSKRISAALLNRFRAKSRVDANSSVH
jgi:beta-lactamase class D